MNKLYIVCTIIGLTMVIALLALFGIATTAKAAVIPSQNQITISPFGGLLVSTSTNGNSKIEQLITSTYGRIPYFNGTKWDTIATSSLGISGSSSLFLATTSPWSGSGVAYRVSDSAVSTVATSAPTVSAPLAYSGTLGAFVGGTGGALSCTTASSGVTGCLSGTDYDTFAAKLSSYDAFTHPGYGGSATTSLLTLGDGIIVGAASSTIAANNLHLGSLSDGTLAVNTEKVYVAATTTAGTGLTYSAGSFNVNNSQNIATLSNLTSNGLIYTAGGVGTLRTAATSSPVAGNGITLSGTSAVIDGNGLTIMNPFAVATSSSLSVGQVSYISAVGGSGSKTTLAGVATSSLSAGTGISFTGTAGALVGGTNLTINSTAGAQLPSWNIKASGGDFTTIQAGLDACGTAGGGWIMLLDTSYTQGGTGLTFKGSNCHIMGRGAGTTTIAFTGATTYFSTNSAAGQYSYNSIQGITITGDSNASSVAFDLSDMTHFYLADTVTDGVGTWVRLNDTQNITFYNVLERNTATSLVNFGINASSTNPTNFNKFIDNFIGCAANCIGFQLNNGNMNVFERNALEPASVTGTKGIYLFDNTLATNDGVFNNIFKDNYVEANGIGIQVMPSVNGSGGGIKRNYFENNFTEAGTYDYLFGTGTSTVPALQTWVNNMDSNFDYPINAFQAPFNVGTSTRLGSISATPRADFMVQSNNVFTAVAEIWTSAGTLVMQVLNTGVVNLKGTWDFTAAVIRAAYSASPTISTNGDFGIDSTSNQWKYQSGSASLVLGNGYFYPSFSYSTSTSWTGTTTIPLGPAFVGETWSQVMCFTDTGTANVSFYDGTNRMKMLNASTTVGTFNLTTNNTFTAAEKRYVDVGTPASSPTKISCTVRKALTAD